MEDAFRYAGWLTTIDGYFFYDRTQQTIQPFEQKAVFYASLPPRRYYRVGDWKHFAFGATFQGFGKRGGLIRIDLSGTSNHFNLIDTVHWASFYGNVVRDSSDFCIDGSEGLYCFDPRFKSR